MQFHQLFEAKLFDSLRRERLFLWLKRWGRCPWLFCWFLEKIPKRKALTGHSARTWTLHIPKVLLQAKAKEFAENKREEAFRS